MRRVVVAAVLAVGLGLGSQPNANAVPPNGSHTVTKSLPTGESVLVTVRWIRHYLGPGGGVPVIEFECDSSFTGPPTSIAQRSEVACSVDGYGTYTSQMALSGPVSAAAGYIDGYESIGKVCVQGTTDFFRLTPLPANASLTVPLTCFS